MLDLIRQRASSWGVKIAFGIIIIVFVFWGVGTSNQGGPGVVATVNGKPILRQDLQQEMAARENQVRAMAPDFSAEDLRSLRIPEQSLQMLVSREIIRQEADRIGMTVTPVELLRFLNSMPVFHGADGRFDQKVYEEAVAKQGRNIAEFEQTLMRDLLGEKMRAYVSSAVAISPEEARRRASFLMEKRAISYVLFATEDFREGITIGDEAIKAYYDANQPQFADPAATTVSYVEVTPATLAPSMTVADEKVDQAYARGPLRYNLRQILLTLPENAHEAKIKEAHDKLEALAKEIRAGKDFAEAAKDASQGPTAAMGGEVGWVPVRDLSPEVLGALAGIAKGDFTAPLRTDGGYSLLQVVESDPDWSLPENEIKAALRGNLALDAATLAFRDVQGQAEDLVALGKPLGEIAQELKVSVKTTNPVPREDLAFVLGLRKPSQVSLFGAEKGTLVHAILETREGFLIAEITDQKAAGIKPLDDVREIILDILTRREAEKKAEEAARKTVAEFANGLPEAYKDKLVTSEAFSRQGEIPGLGLSKGLTDAAFAAPLNEWLKEPYATPKGAVVAMPVESVPLKEEDWVKIEPQIVASLLEAKQSQVFLAFINDLLTKATVKITDNTVFQE
ncbi:SurA N-terminal domain-containing protein [Desulfovibrio sp. OttesenSCG-928-O18]|nr:SurA N-terminal domain-containing protein [Desulfovibrio sp. OttesenSCG-928-O18]